MNYEYSKIFNFVSAPVVGKTDYEIKMSSSNVTYLPLNKFK
jgi:hypothetical protein